MGTPQIFARVYQLRLCTSVQLLEELGGLVSLHGLTFALYMRHPSAAHLKITGFPVFNPCLETTVAIWLKMYRIVYPYAKLWFLYIGSSSLVRKGLRQWVLHSTDPIISKVFFVPQDDAVSHPTTQRQPEVSGCVSHLFS